jgi:hypothetical protein
VWVAVQSVEGTSHAEARDLFVHLCPCRRARDRHGDRACECRRCDAKAACTKGGQAEAKAQMKQFMKDAKIKTCNQCHAKLAPNYDLKDDAYDQFKKAGGK